MKALHTIITNFAKKYLPVLVSLPLLFSCEKSRLSGSEKVTGQELAKKHCSSCHLIPHPYELDEKSWELVLSSMGEFLGFPRTSPEISLFENAALRKNAPAMSTDEWALLKKYYSVLSRERELPRPPEAEPICEQEFDRIETEYQNENGIITWMNVDRRTNLLRFADAATGDLVFVNSAGKIARRLHVGYAVTGAATIDGTEYFIAARNLLPNDEADGIIFTITGNKIKVLRKDLIRPVYISALTTQQGRSYVIISEFGNLSGRLSAFDVRGGMQRQVLSAKPGYLSTQIMGNQILALRAQADEGIFSFDASLRDLGEKSLLRFTPTWGSSSMIIRPLGRETDTIIVTNGDNGDIPGMPVKVSHGIRIFSRRLQDWKETFFYPMPGAYAVATANLNNDSIPDLIGMAYFTAPGEPIPRRLRLLLSKPEEGKYSACRIEHGDENNWITMDVADINGDGLTDIVLGSASTTQFTFAEKKQAASEKSKPVTIFLQKKKTKL